MNEAIETIKRYFGKSETVVVRYRFDEKRSTDTEYVFIRNLDKSHPEE